MDEDSEHRMESDQTPVSESSGKTKSSGIKKTLKGILQAGARLGHKFLPSTSRSTS